VVSLWAAHQNAGDLSAVDLARAEAAWVLRPDLSVSVIPVDAAAGAFAAAVLDDQPLGAAAEAAVRADATFDLPATLAQLISCGALISLTSGGASP
jgi:hypothetical protein